MFPGRNFSIYFDDLLIAAVRSKSVSLQRESIDESDGEDNGWQYFNETPDTRSISVSVEGLASLDNFDLLDEFFTLREELPSMRLVFADGRELNATGGAFLRNLQYNGEVAGAVLFSAAFDFAGELENVDPGQGFPQAPIQRVYFEAATWTKLEFLRELDVVVVGGGGGGGSGSNAGQTRRGGGGGGGGGYSTITLQPADLGESETVTVGAGGSGGAAVPDTGTDTDGHPGQVGGSSSFGSHVTAGGGGGGEGGTFGINPPIVNGGSGGTGDVAGGGGGNNTASGAHGTSGSSSTQGGGGGGGGGGRTTIGGIGPAAAGGAGNTADENNVGGAAGVSGGSPVGGGGTDSTAFGGGGGGSGGGGTGGFVGSERAAGNGGTAGIPGGGGGGGGSNTESALFSSGAGAPGASGVVRVIEYYPTYTVGFSPVGAMHDESYSGFLTVTGVLGEIELAPPYTWEIVSGLPAGLSLNGSTGEISGTVSNAIATGYHTFTVRVTNGNGESVEVEVEIGVGECALLLHLDGADGSTTFTDATGVHSFAAVATAQIDDAQAKFGESLLLDGNSDDIRAADSPDWTLNNAIDFTLDLWARFDGAPAAASMEMVNHYNFSGNQRAWRFFRAADGRLIFQYYQTGNSSPNANVEGVWNPAGDTWYHVAIARRDSHYYLFLDGQLVADGAAAHDIHNSTARLTIGASDNASNPFDGWIDEVRLMLGAARWIEDFTPPDAPSDFSP